ncbi:RagB/SusD family nutrient uptake outer membrane protein [Echinicola shivajiensis]|uniref:RagB/SusD family nutrient uptake outer membrane protein n=1 Tax=Echinicola shivajiensis TaxID=1035916 RepID=UPI001BFC4BA9|nr:RagB/SusD family nutrient uptake outer membrane protein [Echinicola shivajiensis]
MRTIKNFILVLVSWAGMMGCTEFLDPMIDGTISEEEAFANHAYFSGLLNEVYFNLPNLYDIGMDCATDNAVFNDYSANYLKASTGMLSPMFNPFDNWVGSYRNIRRLNQFLDKMVLDPSKAYLTPVRFTKLGTPADSLDNINTFYRLLGEAYFLRAYNEFQLLQAYGGEGANGELLGFPIVTEVLNVDEDLDLPRDTYEACVSQIIADCDMAIKHLPIQYKGNNAVLGESMNGRASGISAMALKARTLLYAASPAFNTVNDRSKWEDAARAAGKAIVELGGLTNLTGVNEFYFTRLNDKRFDIKDQFLRGAVLNNNNAYENDHYPPSMYGNGRVNPSQNYVDAFPDNEGYPISESTSYDPADPYLKRDPRLKQFVAVNGSSMGPNNYHTVETFVGGTDAFNPSRNTTRSGYYLKKLLRSGNVRLIPGNQSSTSRATVLLGLPELYLNYAEAASEAWGAAMDPEGYGFTAAQAISKIHQRYGASDVYMNKEALMDPMKFRELVRNERRLELSFEGHYYWDLRRWLKGDDLSPLNKEVHGIKITKDSEGELVYDRFLLEKKEFASPFSPIPYNLLYSSSKLVQNKGWN